MTTINLAHVPFFYESKEMVINVSEKNVRFDTTYEVISLKGNKKTFEFHHSTGPEFSPTTKWIYKSAGGLLLSVWNDPAMCENAASNYLAAKTRNS